MDDESTLERFVTAQDRDGTYEQAVSELRAGRKRSHWMWFVFPQLRGLGHTQTAQFYGLASGDEASAYLAHDVLGPRLRRCTQLVARSGAVTAAALMGEVDAMKLKSSMTLFAAVTDDNDDFLAVLRKYYRAGRDLKTLDMLKAERAEEVPAAPPAEPRRRWYRWPGR